MTGPRPRPDADFAAEIDAHLALETDRLIAEGLAPDAARAAAHRAFGNDGQRRVEFYESRRLMWLDHARRDVRAALRALRRRPGLAALAMGTLALGIGVNLAMFSVLRVVLVQPPPFAAADRLVMAWQTDRASGTTREPASIPDYADLRARASTLSQVEAFAGTDVNVTPAAGEEPFRMAALAVSQGFLPMLGIEPRVGRGFTAEEDRPGAPRVAMISARLWMERYAGARDIVGRTLTIDDQPHTIVGVAPTGADYGILQVLSAAAYGRAFADRGRVAVDAWLPLRADPATASRDNHPILVMGRLAPHATVAAAGDEVSAIAADLERDYPQSNDERGAFVEPLDAVVLGPVRPALHALSGAVLLVLLVACVNVACLLLVQSASRAREVAVRTALGAGRRRLIGQFLAEGAVLSAGATVAGVAMAWGVLRLLVAYAPVDVPGVQAIALERDGLLAATLLAVVTTLGAAIVPALQARQAEAQQALQAAGGRSAAAGGVRRRMLGGLVIAQIGLALILATAAGLLLRSLSAIGAVDTGFTTEGVLKAEYQLPFSRYPRAFAEFPRWPSVTGFQEALLRRVDALPGVTAAAVASDHPLAAGSTNSFVVVGREAEARDWPEISVRSVSAGYAAVTGLSLLEGRLIERSDTVDAPPVLLINATARRLFFADREALGQQLAFWGTPRTIVGVVADERIHGITEAAPPVAYAAAPQLPLTDTLLVRVAGAPMTIVPDLRAILRDIDPGLALFGVEPLSQTVASSIGRQRFTTWLIGGFAAVTLLLAALGVYGVLSHGVAQRTAEIGVRLALGARPASVVGLVLSEGLRLALAGIAVGLAGALVSTRLVAALLYGVSPRDTVTFVVAAVLLAGVAALASYLPARRASRVDPVVALRAE